MASSSQKRSFAEYKLMTEATLPYKNLEELMDEENRQYHLLIEEIKEEAKYLREDTVEPLLKSIAKIDNQREILSKINEEIRDKLKMFANSSELKEDTLARSIPRQTYQKWQKHQREVSKLKERVRQLNLENKAFIQEILGYWKEIMGLITAPGKNLSYTGVKGSNQKVSPFFLNQKV